MDIIEGNKLIEEFMADDWSMLCDNYVWKNHGAYDESWDRLMPVVEKISKDFDVSISSVGMWACYISRSDSDVNDSVADFGGHEPMILNVWNAVVKFLEWYNKQPKYNNQ